MKSKTKILMLIMILTCAVFLSGCWDNVELNERHVVLDIAIDKDPKDNKEKPDEEGPVPGKDLDSRYIVTYSIPDIKKLSGGESLGEEVKTVMSIKSPTFARSVSKIEDKVQNTVSFSHTKAILMGETLIRDKALFKSALDSLLENMEIGRETYILAVNGFAGEICKTENYHNPIVGLYIMKYFGNAERAVSGCEEQTIGNLFKELVETNVSTIPLITENKGQSTLDIGGAAVVKDYKFVDWLTKEQVRSKLFLEGKVRSVPIVLKLNDQYFNYEIKDQTCEIAYKEYNDKLIADIKINVKGKLVEYNQSLFQNDTQYEEVLLKIEQLINQEIEKEIRLGIDKAQNINVDFLHISNDIYKRAPYLWNKYKSKIEDQPFKVIQININVDSDIQGIGMM